MYKFLSVEICSSANTVMIFNMPFIDCNKALRNASSDTVSKLCLKVCYYALAEY